MACCIDNGWKKLGRLLGVIEAVLVAVDKDHDKMSEKGYHMLIHWKRSLGTAASYKVLYEALLHPLVQRQDLAEMFCQGGHIKVITIIFFYIKCVCCGLMVLNALGFRSSNLGLSPGKVHCVIELTLLCAICSMFTLNYYYYYYYY